jgi:hypothetical protein
MPLYCPVSIDLIEGQLLILLFCCIRREVFLCCFLDSLHVSSCWICDISKNGYVHSCSVCSSHSMYKSVLTWNLVKLHSLFLQMLFSYPLPFFSLLLKLIRPMFGCLITHVLNLGSYLLNLAIFLWLHFWSLYSVPFICCLFFFQGHIVLITVAL